MDSTVRIWDVFRSKKCVMTINGQKGAVRDVQWNWDGRQLLTCGFDHDVRLIDVETGKLIQNYTHKEHVSALCWHPKQHSLFLAGGVKAGIACWDTQTNKVVTQYSAPFGQVQSLEFINDAKQFVSSAEVLKRNSTDRAIMVWDFNTSAVLSNQVYLEVFSCPSIKSHPDNKHFLAQSNGNYIAIFSTTQPYKLNKKKI
eukprot:TRINITY_DN25982_c0_g1_i1.p1 TRINITY_DN25982_c0_g1~~TRINITY_DN25982_c0_g1_i1.p1  ORF type:complete len:199 (+),score=38.07 TRINITY_DN25982_c0_g1_i1:356-952(+)